MRDYLPAPLRASLILLPWLLDTGGYGVHFNNREIYTVFRKEKYIPYILNLNHSPYKLLPASASFSVLAGNFVGLHLFWNAVMLPCVCVCVCVFPHAFSMRRVCGSWETLTGLFIWLNSCSACCIATAKRRRRKRGGVKQTMRRMKNEEGRPRKTSLGLALATF